MLYEVAVYETPLLFVSKETLLSKALLRLIVMYLCTTCLILGFSEDR